MAGGGFDFGARGFGFAFVTDLSMMTKRPGEVDSIDLTACRTNKAPTKKIMLLIKHSFGWGCTAPALISIVCSGWTCGAKLTELSSIDSAHCLLEYSIIYNIYLGFVLFGM